MKCRAADIFADSSGAASSARGGAPSGLFGSSERFARARRVFGTGVKDVNRLLIETRGVGSWRDRLASPDRHWKRGYSAFETAVCWKVASKTSSGIPGPLATILRAGGLEEPFLLFAIGEHKVDLPGGPSASQSDVWALIKTTKGLLSLSVEAKAREPFGEEILEQWLIGGGTALSSIRRQARWHFIRSHLPEADSFLPVRYQMLHRCAAAVIEASAARVPTCGVYRAGFQYAGRELSGLCRVLRYAENPRCARLAGYYISRRDFPQRRLGRLSARNGRIGGRVRLNTHVAGGTLP